MLCRTLLGAGVSASAILASSQFIGVAHAAPAKNSRSDAATAKSDDEFLPVYDDEVPQMADPLPGTAVQSADTKGAALADAESALARKLDIEKVRAEGHVYRISKALQQYVGAAREVLDRQIAQAELKSEELSHKYRESERHAAKTVAALKPESEELLPEAIYVLIAGLSGSIFARRRNFAVRAVAPWLFGGVAFAYFLPQTWSNVRGFVWQHEQEQFPTFAKQHAKAQDKLEDLTREGTEAYVTTKQQAKSTLATARDKIRSWIGH